MTDEVRAIEPEATYALRHRILRPNQPLEACAYPLDKAEHSFHAGYFREGELLGVGSIFREAQDGSTEGYGWRIRGMAVAREAQGKGLGARILQALIEHAASYAQPGEIWCNGRAAVEGFYARFGFVRQGDIFDLPPLGPHVLLRRPLSRKHEVSGKPDESL